MRNETSGQVKSGLFMVAATVLFIAGLYYIGNKRNMFGSTFRISALFHNVNGLMTGNNVRYAGIDVGTVGKISILNDTAVKVEMIIDQELRQFIRKNAVASIGTDGLMGNKLVNINSVNIPSPPAVEGDMLASLNPIEADEMVRTLHTTNQNLAVITGDMKKITNRISTHNTLWSLLMDTVVASNVKEAIADIRAAGNNSVAVSGDLSFLMQNIRNGKGTAGKILADTSLAGQLEGTIAALKMISERSILITGEMNKMIDRVKRGEGNAGALLMDTSFVYKLNATLDSIREGAGGFNQNMEALKQNILLRGYFRKQEKLKKKGQG